MAYDGAAASLEGSGATASAISVTARPGMAADRAIGDRQARVASAVCASRGLEQSSGVFYVKSSSSQPVQKQTAILYLYPIRLLHSRGELYRSVVVGAVLRLSQQGGVYPGGYCHNSPPMKRPVYLTWSVCVATLRYCHGLMMLLRLALMMLMVMVGDGADGGWVVMVCRWSGEEEASGVVVVSSAALAERGPSEWPLIIEAEAAGRVLHGSSERLPGPR